MITTKQRAYLRSLANNLKPVMQIGKDGIQENSIKQIQDLLTARELIKLKILQNCDQSAKEVAALIQNATQCEIVQVIGLRIVLYKYSTKKGIKHIQLQA